MDMEKITSIIDELIFEAQKAPTWKAENALRCLKMELMKGQEEVEPIKAYQYETLWLYCGACKSPIHETWKYCPHCGKQVKKLMI